MATNNQLNVGLKGASGTGSFAGTTSPTLVTPVLGAASATSINFGGTSLSNYTQGTFTPTFTLQTPGDLSVAYTAQTGHYTRIGRICSIQCDIAFTPTFTTGSGQLTIAGMPFSGANISSANAIYQTLTGVTWPAGTTTISAAINIAQAFVFFRMNGSTLGGQSLIATSIVSGVAIRFQFSLVYTV